MIDPSWDRWITLSILKFFRDQNNLLVKPWNTFAEGEERDPKLVSLMELRVDGPWYSQEPGTTKLEVELNVLCECQAGRDLMFINKMVGDAASIMGQNIPIYKLGNLLIDDGSLLDCLQVVGKVMPHKYGQIRPKIREIQASVDARYWVRL